MLRFSTFRSVPLKGVHAVLKTGSWVRYCIFDLATGKAEQENNFPTSSIAFLGQNERNVAIFTAGQVRGSILLLKNRYKAGIFVLLTVCLLEIEEKFRMFSTFCLRVLDLI